MWAKPLFWDIQKTWRKGKKRWALLLCVQGFMLHLSSIDSPEPRTLPTLWEISFRNCCTTLRECDLEKGPCHKSVNLGHRLPLLLTALCVVSIHHLGVESGRDQPWAVAASPGEQVTVLEPAGLLPSVRAISLRVALLIRSFVLPNSEGLGHKQGNTDWPEGGNHAGNSACQIPLCDVMGVFSLKNAFYSYLPLYSSV